MKVWITKYALTSGILEVEGSDEHMTPGDVFVPSHGLNAYYHGEGREWHKTRESAVRRANAMVLKKLGSFRKQIAKLEKLKFE